MELLRVGSKDAFEIYQQPRMEPALRILERPISERRYGIQKITQKIRTFPVKIRNLIRIEFYVDKMTSPEYWSLSARAVCTVFERQLVINLEDRKTYFAHFVYKDCRLVETVLNAIRLETDSDEKIVLKDERCEFAEICAEVA